MEAAFSALSAQGANAASNALMARQQALSQSLQHAEGNTADTVSPAEKAKMMAKAKDFESFFVYQFLDLMTPENKSAFNGGQGEEMFRHQLNEQVAKTITNAGGFGVSHAVYQELLQNQQAANARRLGAYAN